MMITDKVHTMRVPFKITLNPTTVLDRFVYTNVIFGKEIALVDSGVSSSESVIYDMIEGAGRGIDEISLILHTHSHPDHMGATKAIVDRTGCKVAVHEAERNWMEDIDIQFRDRPVPGFHSIAGSSVKVDRAFVEGDVFDLGGIEIEALHTPGHSDGSTSFLIEKERVLITGDSVPLPGELPIYEDPTASLTSLDRLCGIRGIEHLLSAWDTPREGHEVASVLKEGAEYMRRIDRKVKEVHIREPDLTDLDMCRKALKELGLDKVPPMPLVIRSFKANIASIDRANHPDGH